MKLKNIFYKTILSILFVIVAYITYRSIFDIFAPLQEMKPIVIILGTAVMLFLFIKLKKLINKLNKKQINIIAIILSILFFISLSIFGNLLTCIPSYDLSNIIKEVNMMMQNGGHFVTESYFARYTNQAPSTILIFLIYKLASLFNITPKVFAIIINSLFIAVAAYFTYLTVKKLKNEKAGLLTLIFLVVNPILYLYSSYFYTDTLCMPFLIIAIYIYIYIERPGKRSALRKKYYCLFCWE